MRATISLTHTSIPRCYSLSPIHPYFLATSQVTLRMESAIVQTGFRHLSRGAFCLCWPLSAPFSRLLIDCPLVSLPFISSLPALHSHASVCSAHSNCAVTTALSRLLGVLHLDESIHAVVRPRAAHQRIRCAGTRTWVKSSKDERPAFIIPLCGNGDGTRGSHSRSHHTAPSPRCGPTCVPRRTTTLHPMLTYAPSFSFGKLLVLLTYAAVTVPATSANTSASPTSQAQPCTYLFAPNALN